jgi:hypothetical protein
MTEFAMHAIEIALCVFELKAIFVRLRRGSSDDLDHGV